MGPEIVVAIAGPVVGGAISIFVWVSKKNYEFMNTGFNTINTNMNIIERKVDDLRLDVAKNYVTNEELVAHIKGEDEWHKMMHDEVSSIRGEISKVRDSINRES